ncbi:MAG: hypothetical protein C4583_02750 [Anaerolineaceae bacterium]|nr:MAG: hypothetical protein C4583_02750 [Anaerolineaceae bacterium]
MSSEEQRRILKMVEDGKISADEAMTLIRALEQDSPEAEVEIYEAAPGEGRRAERAEASETTDAPEFEEVKARARRFASIPLWIGVGITVLFAGLMYWAMQTSGFGFWFYCLTFPFLFGVLLIALSSGGLSSRWLFVDVHQKPGEKPGRITLGFPVPLGLVGWAFRNFGHHIHGMDREKADQIAEMIQATASSKSPLIVNAQDDEDGERVMVYIG